MAFDEMRDPAFAEIYCQTVAMEKSGQCYTEDWITEELAKKCSDLTDEFLAQYKVLNAYGEPCFWEVLDGFIAKRIPEEFPPQHEYEVVSIHTVEKRTRIWATSERQACESHPHLLGEVSFGGVKSVKMIKE